MASSSCTSGGEGVDVILQLGVESMVIGARVIDIVFNASVYIGVAYGVTDIMADKPHM